MADPTLADRLEELCRFGGPDDPCGHDFCDHCAAAVRLRKLDAIAHAAWHLMDDSGEIPDEDGEYVHFKIDHDRLSGALDALEHLAPTGTDDILGGGLLRPPPTIHAHPDHLEPRP